MVMHARSGGTLEVMGLILGKVDGNTMFVMDSFALPVEGTETRVNAQAQAYEYMSSYIEAAKLVRGFLHHPNELIFICFSNRLADKKMQLVGTTATLDMGVGCRVLTLAHRCLIKTFRSHLLPLSSTLFVLYQLEKCVLERFVPIQR